METPNQNLVILIVEDNRDFLRLLCVLLEQLNFSQLLHAANYEDAVQIMDNEPRIDVFILDIMLGAGKSGIMLGEEIRRRKLKTPIIYLTSHYSEEFYLLARHTRPSSFLNKELSRLKISMALDLALNPLEESDQVIAHIPQVSEHNFYFKVGDAFKAFSTTDILYFYADQKMSFAKIGNRSYPTSVQLKTLEEELPTKDFLRIHKSYIVNTRHIEAIHPGESAVVVQGESLPLGNAFRKDFMAALRLLK